MIVFEETTIFYLTDADMCKPCLLGRAFPKIAKLTRLIIIVKQK